MDSSYCVRNFDLAEAEVEFSESKSKNFLLVLLYRKCVRLRRFETFIRFGIGLCPVKLRMLVHFASRQYIKSASLYLNAYLTVGKYIFPTAKPKALSFYRSQFLVVVVFFSLSRIRCGQLDR